MRLGRAERSALAAGAWCAAGAAVALWETLAGFQVLAGSDYLTLHYPFLRYAADTWRAAGELPRWLPHLYCGMPFIGSMNSGLLYPTELAGVLAGADPTRAMAAGAVLHAGLAGAGTAWWLDHEGLSPGAARLGALAYACSGLVFTQLGVADVNTFRAAAWLPWFVEAFRLACGGSTRAFVAAAVIAALLLVDCAIQMLAFALPWCVLLAAGHRWRAAPRAAVVAAGVAVAGAAAGAAWLLPALDYFRLSERAAVPPGFAAQWALHPGHLAGLLWPGFWGRTSYDTIYFGPHLSDNTSRYPGVLAVALAAAGLRAAGRRRRAWLLAGAAALLLAAAPRTPLWRLLGALPVYGAFRGWIRWLLFANLPFVLLVAEGWERVAAADRAARRTLLAVAALAAAAGLAAWAGREMFVHPWVERSVRTVHGLPGTDLRALVRATTRSALARTAVAAPLGLVAAGAVCALPAGPAAALAGAALAGDLLENGRRFAEQRFPYRLELEDDVGPYLDAQEGTWRVAGNEPATGKNVRIHHGVEMIEGYHGVPPVFVVDFLREGMRAQNPFGVLRALNVRYVVLDAPMHHPDLASPIRLHGPGGRPAWVYEVRDPRERIFFPETVVGVPDGAGALEVITQFGWSARVAPVEDGAGWPAAPAPGRLLDLAVGANERVARLRARGPAVAVISEVGYPGWRLWLDGARIRPRRADGILMAVLVPAGDHDLRLRYDPVPFRLGVWLSLMALAGAGAAASLGRAQPADRDRPGHALDRDRLRG